MSTVREGSHQMKIIHNHSLGTGIKKELQKTLKTAGINTHTKDTKELN